MKVNDIVTFTGCTESQLSWGSYTGNPTELVIGERYMIEKIEVHSWHTKVWLKNVDGSFNSVCFEVFESKYITYECNECLLEDKEVPCRKVSDKEINKKYCPFNKYLEANWLRKKVHDEKLR